MKAIVCHSYGSPDVLELAEIDTPVPEDGQVLIRVHAASVNPLDWHNMRGVPYLIRISGGLTKPKTTVLGADLAGTVEAVGKDVKDVRPGDQVFGMGIKTCADYVRVLAEGVVPKPANVTFEQAAAVPVAAITALQGLRDKGRIKPGHKVLVNGAAGGVGTFAVQIAKSFGADVTGVCSTRNVELVRSLGADRVIDYTQEDFTRSGERYELILDAVGNRPLSECRRVLASAGTLVMVGAGDGRSSVKFAARALKGLVVSRFGSQTLVFFVAKRNKDDLMLLRELLEGGKVTPVIDRQYPLAEVPEAIRYLEAGHAQGKVVITVSGAATPSG
jgi:NADPH:quinone reductase-like Zn-dependent oxidoreductase